MKVFSTTCRAQPYKGLLAEYLKNLSNIKFETSLNKNHLRKQLKADTILIKNKNMKFTLILKLSKLFIYYRNIKIVL